jgi:hypothetical protein
MIFTIFAGREAVGDEQALRMNVNVMRGADTPSAAT